MNLTGPGFGFECLLGSVEPTLGISFAAFFNQFLGCRFIKLLMNGKVTIILN